ncbi:MAG: GT2 family glycosyltransferase [Myxococcota bacterium]
MKQAAPACVIVPVHNGASTLSACLAALRPQGAVIVVDDRSTDDSARLARDAGADVIAVPHGRRGAGAARNVGVDASEAEILVFVDADVVVRPGAIARLLAPIRAGACDAAVGVYGETAPGSSPLSRAKNTTIRASHGRSGAQIQWFWTGFSAIRKSTFVAAGGFDEAAFEGATIEDMELGFRLSQNGVQIRQVFEARATHLHHFGPVDLVRNDFRKARDWARILANQPGLSLAHGATGPQQVLGAACAATTLLGAASWWLIPVGPGLMAAGLVGLNYVLRDEVALARAEGGPSQALSHLCVRAALYPAAVAGAAVGAVGERLKAA